MKLEDLKNAGKNLLFFTKSSLSLLEKDSNNLSANLKYWLRSGDIIALKKGFYILSDNYRQEPDKTKYLEYLANNLLTPAYLSLEYVLNKYQLLTESSQALTLVSRRSSRTFFSSLAVWRYYSLPERLFNGYQISYFKNQPIAEASKAKALFDFLYLRFRRGPEPSQTAVDNLRLNWENISSSDKKELFSYFQRLSGRRWEKLIIIIEKYVA